MFGLSDQQQALQELARTFAAREVRPVAKIYDSEPDLRQRFPWEVLRRASELGLRTLALPGAEGGPGLDVLTHCLVFEELAYGDVGFATTLDQTWRLTSLLTLTETTRSALLPSFEADPLMLLALAAGNGKQPVAAPPRGGHWLLEGERRSVVAGGVAKLVFVEAGETGGKTTLFAVRSDQPGFRAELVDKAGRRLEPMADLTLAGYVAGKADRVGADGEGTAILEQLNSRYSSATAMGAVAVARSAYDLAVDWAYRRIQGGKPIYQHPAVATKIGDMYVGIEASRSLALRAASAVDGGAASADALGMAAKVLSAQTANRVCYDAMQIWGGMGFMREGGMEKFTRDAVGYYSENRIDALRERMGHGAVEAVAGR